MWNGTLVFRWSSIAGATGYQVNVNNQGWIPANRALAHQITGLRASESVSIQVRAIPGVVLGCDAAIGTAFQVYGQVCLFDLQYDSLRTIPIACYGGSTPIQFTSVNGTAPITYYIDGVAQRQNPIFSTIRAGAHFALGIDSLGCRDSLYFNLRQPDSLALSIATTPSTVGGATGTASITVTGGVPTYRYAWARGDTTATIRNLTPNTYIVTVTDANGCRKTATISIITNHLSDDLVGKCNIRVYPNPVLENRLTITLESQQKLENPLKLELRDALGRWISDLGQLSESARLELELPHLAKGAYFLIFQSGHLKTVKPIYIF
jgi:hypothetical protein